ncbi:hypothetical protein CF60_26395 [Escherichia coli]|nr:hypothetical protein CF60_26395 [Escherichia coli]
MVFRIDTDRQQLADRLQTKTKLSGMADKFQSLEIAFGLRPARDRRLGEPLPHLLANPIWAHPMARGPKVPLFGLATLCGISYRFQ